jgi:hypothetical protein
MVKVDRLSGWLQIVANLGLIAGLVLVAVEIQQTRDLARVQLQVEGTLAFQQVEIAMLGESPAEAWARSILDPDSLSPMEVKIVDSWLIHQVNQWRRTAFMEAEGLAEPGATERKVRENAWFYFGNPFAKRWWRTIKRDGGWEPAFARIVDSQLAALEDTQNARWIEEMLSGATGAPAP